MTSYDLPVLIFQGNCQSHHLAAIFSGAHLAEAYVCGSHFGFVPSFRKVMARYLSEVEVVKKVREARSAGRRCILVQQMTPLENQDIATLQREVDEVIRFPFLQFLAMAPGSNGHISNPRRFRKIYDLDLSCVKISQEKSESTFDFAAFIAEKHPLFPLFHASTHPGPLLTAILFEEVAKKVTPDQARLIFGARREVEESEGMNFMTEHPFSKAAQEVLSFNWPESYQLYLQMIGCMGSNDWGWFAENFELLTIYFSHDSQFQLALGRSFMDHANAWKAEIVFKKLVQREPGCSLFWSLLLEATIISSPKSVPDVILMSRNRLKHEAMMDVIHPGMVARAREFNLLPFQP